MPRYEKVGKSKSQFFEILVISDRAVMTAEGERAGTDGEWSIDRKSPRTWFPPGANEEFVAEKVAALVAKKYVLMGDQLQVLKPLPPPTPEEIETSKRIREYTALVDKNEPVMWTGKTPETADQFVEVRIEVATGGKTPGLNVLVRTGKLGTKGTTEKDNYVHRKHALHVAAVRLNSARDRGFGP